jgi:hypothetical protein
LFNKNYSFGTIAVLMVFITLFAFFVVTYSSLEIVNPAAALAAIAVAVVGLVWFKRTVKP